MVKDFIPRAHVAVLSVLLLCLTMNDRASNIIPVAEAIWLTVPSSGSKCVSEEIQGNVVVLGGYYVLEEDHSYGTSLKISARITSPYGNTLHENQNVSHGEFAFTSEEAGEYMACFWMDHGRREQTTGLSLGLDWKIGIDAKDWDSVAKKEKIEGVELQLRKLEALVNGIHHRLLYLKQRDLSIREMDETTNSKVILFSIMSIGICIVTSILQLWYLKSYFIRKRLI